MDRPMARETLTKPSAVERVIFSKSSKKILTTIRRPQTITSSSIRKHGYERTFTTGIEE